VKIWIAGMLLMGFCGCNRYAMQDIKIVNASDKLGYDVYAVCDTCQEHGKCGSRNESTVWANEHAKETGHKTFTRQACSMGLTPVLRGPQEHRPPTSSNPAPKRDEWSNPDTVLQKGMTVEQARSAIDDVGTTESETTVDTGVRRTVRFRQVGKGANAGSTRSAWGTFDNGKLTDVKYGAWVKN
jgi:hypothetical protein